MTTFNFGGTSTPATGGGGFSFGATSGASGTAAPSFSFGTTPAGLLLSEINFYLHF